MEIWIEIFGVITGLLFVILEVRQSSWLWPVGLVTSATYVFVFFNGKFYADMGLQLYYVVISLYGWYHWVKGAEQNKTGELPVGRTSSRQWIVLVFSLLGLWVGIYFILKEFTDSTVPVGDAFTTALGIVATWMLAHKLIEQWFLWIVANLVSAALYLYKGLNPTVFLYLVYGGMSIYGYFEWKRSMKKQASHG